MNRSGYEFRTRMNAGLVGLTSRYGRQLWNAITLRKSKPCAVCEKPIVQGSRAFTGITNGDNRMERICVLCIDDMERGA